MISQMTTLIEIEEKLILVALLWSRPERLRMIEEGLILDGCQDGWKRLCEGWQGRALRLDGSLLGSSFLLLVLMNISSLQKAGRLDLSLKTESRLKDISLLCIDVLSSFLEETCQRQRRILGETPLERRS